jgi:predicted membrane channel-forming protein YqfA (hemolysin III family)
MNGIITSFIGVAILFTFGCIVADIDEGPIKKRTKLVIFIVSAAILLSVGFLFNYHHDPGAETWTY